MKLSEEQKTFILNNRVGSNVYEKEKQRFMILPHSLVYGELYEGLSSDAIFAWVILNDRSKLSKKNGWFDEDGSIYFIYTIDELISVLKKSRATVVKIKKELENFGLLEQKRQGKGKSNRLYIYEPVLTEKDFELLFQLQENIGAENVDNTQKFKNYTSRSLNSKLLEVQNLNSNNNKYNNTNIINISESANAESNKELSTEQYFEKSELLTDFSEFGLPESVTKALFRATRNSEEVSAICGVIFQAKRYVSNEAGALILLEDFSEEDYQELTKCILRALKNIMTKRSVQSYDKYLFVTLRNFFSEYVNKHQLCQ